MPWNSSGGWQSGTVIPSPPIIGGLTSNRLLKINSSSQVADGSLLDSGSGDLKVPGTTTDAVPTVLDIIGAHVWPGATSNTTGAAVRLAPGIGRRIITVDDYSQAGVGTVTVTVNGTATVLTAGTDFTAATSNNVTATNLATAIDAIAGVTATAASAVVRVTPDDTTYSLTLARSVAAFATVTTGTNGAVNVGYGDLLAIGPTNLTLASGQLLLPDGTASLPAQAFSGDTGNDTGPYLLAANQYAISTAGTGQLRIYNSGSNAFVAIPSTGQWVWDSSTIGSGPDTGLARAAAGIVQFTDGSTGPGTPRFLNTNAGYEQFPRNTEAHTLAAAGTSTTSTAVWPANSASQAASFRITTEITGCTSVQVGVAADTTRYGTFSTLTAGQTIAIGRIDNYAAQTGILFTAVGGGASFTAGVVRVNLRYVTASAPTS